MAKEQVVNSGPSKRFVALRTLKYGGKYYVKGREFQVLVSDVEKLQKLKVIGESPVSKAAESAAEKGEK
ncbi:MULTISPECIES: hypothetical protein [Acidobacterium]|uniref:DUF7210 domain-containing protein n=1 Tax=Acidobacterium capsulatum (strain ATCC 51196 / DSM 11244 / BCRC 80197 / JCM 7670 / NBRC 15755 / NCIMB 13165 / 161) TaxID=240015 RepID=C1FA25_ACIC5|nr:MULTISPECIES: hypothetical protein [Acidobacterium]ACO33651.1 hypothetical protein ACP_0406 [Acidobacterium capsulatum ATCC 51196]HCT62051.1 hypothetical protein [Acidobacterium sp.]